MRGSHLDGRSRNGCDESNCSEDGCLHCSWDRRNGEIRRCRILCVVKGRKGSSVSKGPNDEPIDSVANLERRHGGTGTAIRTEFADAQYCVKFGLRQPYDKRLNAILGQLAKRPKRSSTAAVSAISETRVQTRRRLFTVSQLLWSLLPADRREKRMTSAQEQGAGLEIQSEALVALPGPLVASFGMGARETS